MDAKDITAKLTEREKEALRGWLEHKSAKEIAQGLGISHHAVEKRLKMARTKLDAQTSLEAARMLAEAEGYGQAVTGMPDLAQAPKARSSWQHSTTIIGVSAMIIATIAALALANTLQLSDGTEIEVDGNLERVFEHIDEDGSGFLENPESPFVTVSFDDPDDVSDELGKALLGESRNTEQVEAFYAEADTDGDDKISFREYYTWSEARWEELGVKISTIVKVLPSPES